MHQLIYQTLCKCSTYKYDACCTTFDAQCSMLPQEFTKRTTFLTHNSQVQFFNFRGCIMCPMKIQLMSKLQY